MFNYLFISLAQKLSSLRATEGGEATFRYIDQDLGQLEYHDNKDVRPPVAYPCALIDLDSAAYKEIGDNAQTAVLNVNIRIAFPPLSATSAGTPSQYQAKALEYYTIEQSVAKALHGWLPQLTDDVQAADGSTITATEINTTLADTFGSLSRTKAETEQRSDFIRVRTLTFSLAFDDYTTANKHFTMPTPAFIPSFNFEP